MYVLHLVVGILIKYLSQRISSIVSNIYIFITRIKIVIICVFGRIYKVLRI